MLDLRNKRIEDLPIGTARVPIDGQFQRVTGRVVAQTYERDPMLDIRLESGAIVHVRESEADVHIAAGLEKLEPVMPPEPKQ